MIDDLVKVLAAAGMQPTTGELRDALWLASHIAVPSRPPTTATTGVASSSLEPLPPAASLPAQPAASPAPAAASELYAAGDDGGPALTGVAARSPAVPALRRQLELARSLRPLKRRVPSLTEIVVDEDATAARIAEEDIWVPVFRPAPARWLSLALVIDTAPSMVVWRRTVAELRTLADRLGAFRQVREFTMDTSTELVFGAGEDPATLVDPTGRQAVLVITDSVGSAWRDGRAASVLRLWGQAGPTAVLTVLPQRMWKGTGLRAVPAQLHTSGPGVSNREYRKDTPVPILELSPQWIGSWARLVAGGPGVHNVALVGEGAVARAQTVAEPEDLVNRFRAAASPTAFQLACYLSAAWLNLPVMRLVQRVMLPESSTVHLAEVFLGGLLRRCGGSGDPELEQYEFVDGVRDLLNSFLLRDDLLKVFTATTEFVAERFGQTFDFAALLADPEGTPMPAIGGDVGRPLAQVAASVLSKLGGRYQAVADRLAARHPDLPDPNRSQILLLAGAVDGIDDMSLLREALSDAGYQSKFVVIVHSRGISEILRTAVNEADDLLLVCYLGLGRTGSRDIELTPETNPEYSISLDYISSLLRESRARATGLVVDYVPVGRNRKLVARNYYTGSSTARFELCNALPSFGENGVIRRFTDLLKSGIPGAGPLLTPSDILERGRWPATATYSQQIPTTPFYLVRNAAYSETTVAGVPLAQLDQFIDEAAWREDVAALDTTIRELKRMIDIGGTPVPSEHLASSLLKALRSRQSLDAESGDSSRPTTA